MRIRRGMIAVLLLAALLVVKWDSLVGFRLPDLRTAFVPLRETQPWPRDFFEAFPEQFPLQVAVLWLHPSPTPLGLTHAFREMGIPFFITDNVDRALQHQVVFIGPYEGGGDLTEVQARQITQYVAAGGVVFLQLPYWGGFQPLTGSREYHSTRNRYWFNFDEPSSPALRYLNRPEERQVRFSDLHYPETVWTTSFDLRGTNTVILAEYEDHTPALARRGFGRGAVYLCGVDLNYLILRSQNNHDTEAERWYVNHFEPGTDVWLLLLRGWYESHQPDAVRISTMPDGARSVLLVSHDVDWEYAVRNCPGYATVESRARTHSTFFVQTKYMRDAMSHRFFYGKNLDILRQLKAQGFDVESHSVSHCEEFNHFPRGSGWEVFGQYRPYVDTNNVCKVGTVFGEVRVSKSLLDGEIPGQSTIFFRAGHLKYPPTLPEVLERCGYAFDSSMTAGDVLTSFPYVIPFQNGYDRDSSIYEFPVTIEDEEKPALGERVDSALEVIEANAENGAVNVLLIHPSDLEKAQAEARLLERLPPDIPASDMLSFAQFWRARDRLIWQVQPGARTNEVQLAALSLEPVSGLTFEFQRTVEAVEGAGCRQLDAHRLVLPPLVANTPLKCVIRYAP